MRKSLCSLILLPTLAFAYVQGGAKHEPNIAWGYPAQEGKSLKLPEEWGEINPVCKSGKRQSPVNIPLRKLLKTDKKKWHTPIHIQYQDGEFEVFHNRHTVQATALTPSNSVLFNGRKYVLRQFHYHKKSEHLLDGEQFMAEVHFVHEAGPNDLLVIGIFADPLGSGNNLSSMLHSVLDAYPGKSDRYVPVKLKLNPAGFLPDNKTFVTYAGSLTTPPCLETVTWVVLPQVMKLSELDQNLLAAKKFDVGFKNFRPHLELDKSRAIQVGGP